MPVFIKSALETFRANRFIVESVIVMALLLCSMVLSIEAAVDKTLGIRFLACFSILLISLVIFRKKLLKALNDGVGPMDIFLAAFCVWQIMSVAWATNSAEALASGFKSVVLLTAYLLFRSLLHSNDRWKDNLPFLVALSSSVYLVFTWIELLKINDVFGLNTQSIYALRYPSYTKNLVSIFLLGSSVFHIHLIIQSIPWKRWFGLFNLIGIAATLFFFSTRAISVALPAMGLALLLALVFNPRLRFKNGWIAGLILILLGMVHWQTSSVLRSQSFNSYEVAKEPNTEDPKSESTESAYRSANERLVLWEKTVELIKQNPVLGVGAGNWQIEYPRNGLAGLERAELRVTSFKRPHNEALWILSETGVIGLALFILVLLSFFNMVWKGERTGLLFGLACVGFISAAMFDFPRERAEHTVLFAAILALAGQNSRRFQLQKPAQVAVLIMLVSLLLGGSFVYYKRARAEQQYIDLRLLKDEKNYDKGLEIARAMENPFYTVDWLNYPIAWYSGIFHTYQGDFVNGEKEFMRALHFNPWNFHTHNNLGFCLANQGRYDEAVPFFEQALAINGKFEDARFNLAFTLSQKGDVSGALDVLKSNIRDSTKLDVYMREITQLSE